MQHALTPRRRFSALLAASVSLVLLAAGLPHHHDRAAVSHATKTCSVCKLQDGFSATPSHQSEPLCSFNLAAVRVPAERSPRLAKLDLLSAPPRAPPISA